MSDTPSRPVATPQQKLEAGQVWADLIHTAALAFITSPGHGGHRKELADLTQRYRSLCANGSILPPSVYRPRGTSDR
jgi:hypothetical protein